MRIKGCGHMKTIVLVTSQVAPFQVELAEAVNAADPGVKYRVIFTLAENQRPPHWLDLDERIASLSTIAPTGVGHERIRDWAVEELRRWKPDTILIGGIRGLSSDASRAYRAGFDSSVSLGMWMEQPLHNASLARRIARLLDYKRRLSMVDFVLAIGDRAHAFYRACNPNTHFVPYGSDLSACLALPLPKPRGDRTKFLFSGGLQPRHNFPLIMKGFERLFELRGECFEFIVSGDGPEQVVIDAALERTPDLRPLVRYERRFSSWVQRLDPFLEAHVFLYPTDHAGWGLVIPEAMAAGCAAITTLGAEAARYLVDDGHNGMIIEPDEAQFVDALLRCVDDRNGVERMGMAAREAARRCDAPQVARQLLTALRIAQGPRR